MMPVYVCSCGAVSIISHANGGDGEDCTGGGCGDDDVKDLDEYIKTKHDIDDVWHACSHVSDVSRDDDSPDTGHSDNKHCEMKDKSCNDRLADVDAGDDDIAARRTEHDDQFGLGLPFNDNTDEESSRDLDDMKAKNLCQVDSHLISPNRTLVFRKESLHLAIHYSSSSSRATCWSRVDGISGVSIDGRSQNHTDDIIVCDNGIETSGTNGFEGGNRNNLVEDISYCCNTINTAVQEMCDGRDNSQKIGEGNPSIPNTSPSPRLFLSSVSRPTDPHSLFHPPIFFIGDDDANDNGPSQAGHSIFDAHQCWRIDAGGGMNSRKNDSVEDDTACILASEGNNNVRSIDSNVFFPNTGATGSMSRNHANKFNDTVNTRPLEPIVLGKSISHNYGVFSSRVNYSSSHYVGDKKNTDTGDSDESIKSDSTNHGHSHKKLKDKDNANTHSRKRRKSYQKLSDLSSPETFLSFDAYDVLRPPMARSRSLQTLHDLAGKNSTFPCTIAEYQARRRAFSYSELDRQLREEQRLRQVEYEETDKYIAALPVIERNTTIAMTKKTKEQGGDRPRWNSKMEYLLAAVGYSVGLGNLWRFPFISYENGGGAFLFCYFTCLVLIGLPMFIVETAVGQRMQTGHLTFWRLLSARLTGIGLSSCCVVAVCAVYYMVIISWSLYYLFNSFALALPWSHGGINDADSATKFFFESCQQKTSSMSGGLPSGLTSILWFNWPLVLSLTLAWILVYISLWKGFKTKSGKVIYFTGIFPFVALFILLCRGATLPGAEKGIVAYFVPEWSHLLHMRAWVTAGSQIFHSLGIAWGSLMNFASFNPVKNNLFKDAYVLTAVSAFTSFLAGLVVFSIVGFMSHISGQSVDEVAKVGSGFAFVVYPVGLAQMPWSPFFSILFFSMLICLGIDTEFTMMEVVMTTIVEGSWFRKMKKELLTAMVCVILWLCGWLLVSPYGPYWVDLMDTFSGTIAIFVLALCEVVALSAFYGMPRLADDIQMMTGKSIKKPFRLIHEIGLPLLLILMIFCGIYMFAIPEQGNLHFSQMQRDKKGKGCMGSPVACSGKGKCVLSGEEAKKYGYDSLAIVNTSGNTGEGNLGNAGGGDDQSTEGNIVGKRSVRRHRRRLSEASNAFESFKKGLLPHTQTPQYQFHISTSRWIRENGLRRLEGEEKSPASSAIDFAMCFCENGWGGDSCDEMMPPGVLWCPENCNGDKGRGQCNEKTGICTCAAVYDGPSCMGDRYASGWPTWAICLGWFIALGTLLPIPLIMLWRKLRKKVKKGIDEKICTSSRPTKSLSSSSILASPSNGDSGESCVDGSAALETQGQQLRRRGRGRKHLRFDDSWGGVNALDDYDTSSDESLSSYELPYFHALPTSSSPPLSSSSSSPIEEGTSLDEIVDGKISAGAGGGLIGADHWTSRSSPSSASPNERPTPSSSSAQKERFRRDGQEGRISSWWLRWIPKRGRTVSKYSSHFASNSDGRVDLGGVDRRAHVTTMVTKPDINRQGSDKNFSHCATSMMVQSGSSSPIIDDVDLCDTAVSGVVSSSTITSGVDHDDGRLRKDSNFSSDPPPNSFYGWISGKRNVEPNNQSLDSSDKLQVHGADSELTSMSRWNDKNGRDMNDDCDEALDE